MDAACSARSLLYPSSIKWSSVICAAKSDGIIRQSSNEEYDVYVPYHDGIYFL